MLTDIIVLLNFTRFLHTLEFEEMRKQTCWPSLQPQRTVKVIGTYRLLICMKLLEKSLMHRLEMFCLSLVHIRARNTFKTFILIPEKLGLMVDHCHGVILLRSTVGGQTIII